MQFVITQEQDGRLLRNLLQSHYKLSRRLLRRLVQTNGVERNGKPVYMTERVQVGDIINITLPKEESHLLPTTMPLDIRYEDREIVVVNKPPGVLSHPTAWEREGSLLAGLLAYFDETEIVPHCVHRLDRDTSGLVMFAKNSHAHHLYDVALQSKLIHRSYTALVHMPAEAGGSPPTGWQTIDLPIGGDRTQPSRRVISFDGQPSITHYRFVYQSGSVGVVQLALETGRTHQIRLHLAAIGMPVVGDPHYGWNHCILPGGQERLRAQEEFEELRKLIERQALHAYRLEWTHAVTKDGQSVFALPPEDFTNVLLRQGTSKEQLREVEEKLLQAPFAPIKAL